MTNEIQISKLKIQMSNELVGYIGLIGLLVKKENPNAKAQNPNDIRESVVVLV
jgi:hypothetical protein